MKNNRTKPKQMYNLITKNLWVPFRLPNRLLLTMKLIVFVIFIAMMQAKAASYAQKITLSEKNTPLEKVFDKISLQSGFDFFISESLLKTAKPVTIQVRNADLPSVLKLLFKNQPLEFLIQDKAIVVKAKPDKPNQITSTSININVHGRVVDEEEKPLAGATISILKIDSAGPTAKQQGDFSVGYKGRNAVAQTDANGEFNLKNIEESTFIIISYTGYRVYQAKAAQEMGTIKMTPDGNLKEVNITINTGYQSIARERSAGSIAKPNMDILKNRSTAMNIIQRLDGLVPGLTINNAPGATPVLVRGLTSINSSRAPLYVVNGIPIADISTVNPDDVEDITVLKDATSAAIWGAKAANGVIVVTTKKGQSNAKLKINYDAFVNFQGKPDLSYQNMMNSSQYIQTVSEIFNDPTYSWKTIYPYTTISTPVTGGSAPVSPHETIWYNQANLPQSQVNAALAQLASQNNLQQISDLWYRNASLMKHSLSLAGGGNKYSFYGSINYINTQNSTPNQKDQNYTMNLRQDFRFNDRIKMYLITDLQHQNTSAANMIQPTATFLPYAMFLNPDGSNADLSWLYRTDEVRKGYEQGSLVDLRYNPLNEINTGNSTGNLIRGRVTAGVTVNIWDGLRYEGVFGITRAQNKTTNLLDQNNYAVRSELASFTIAASNPGERPTYLLPENGGHYTTANAINKDWTVRNQLVYDKAWNNKHQLTLLVGQEAQEQFNNTTTSKIRGYNSQLMSYGVIDYAALAEGVPNTVMPTAGTSSSLFPDYFNETEYTQRISSYYANGGYTFLGKYTFNGGIRIDESNLFGKDKSAQNRPVWSVGLAWELGKESFMKSHTWLDRLALRSSYGITGNSPEVGTAASSDILTVVTNLNYPGGTGLSLQMPANRALSWETTKTFNVGIDFAILGNRLSGTIDLYHKKTEDLIGEMTLNPFTGFPTITGNAGKMTNKGIDLSISSANLQQGALKWRTTFNMAYNQNKITSLNSTIPISLGSDMITQAYLEGYPAFSVFAYTYAGLDHLGDPQIRLNDGSVAKARNVAKPEDVKYMGSFQPKWSGGMNNTFGYKDFSLSVNLIYNLGYVFRRDVASSYSGRDMFLADAQFNGNLNADFVNRWKKPGDEAFTNIPAYLPSATEDVNRRDIDYYCYADINVEDASYIKFRDITLSYSLPKKLIGKIKADAVTFRAQLSNIMLWKANNVGIDPEFQTGTGGTRTPLTNQHSFTLGAHVTF